MRLGLVASNVGEDCIQRVREVPRAAEEFGFSSVWFTDHVVGLKAYQPVYRGEWAESLTSLTWAAATTSRVGLGVGVLVAPLRDPVYAAKVIATIDQLSGGRVILGVGTGWAYREYEALGRAHLFERRGAATDEAIEVMRRCWQGGVFGFRGEFTSFKEIEFAPTPLQRPGPPLWVGGQTGRALKRAARYADVWHPTRLLPGEVRERGERLDELAGREIPRSIRLSYRTAEKGEKDTVLRRIDDYVRAGCEDIVIEAKVDTVGELLREAESLAALLL